MVLYGAEDEHQLFILDLACDNSAQARHEACRSEHPTFNPHPSPVHCAILPIYPMLATTHPERIPRRHTAPKEAHCLHLKPLWLQAGTTFLHDHMTLREEVVGIAKKNCYEGAKLAKWW